MHTHAIVEVLGKPRRLFSLKEGKRDASVMVMIASPGAAGSDYGPEYEGARVKNEKYSIHSSRESQQQLNSIMYTMTLDDGREIKQRHDTAAIKVHGRFAPVGVFLAPDLRSDRYIQRSPPMRKMDFGQYDARTQTLVFAIFAGPRVAGLEHADQPDLQIRHASFSLFTIVAMHALFPWPSGPLGARLGIRTMPSPGLSEDEMGARLRQIAGLDLPGCADYFRAARDTLIRGYVQRMSPR